MTMSEIMTITIAFHMSNHRDFKNYYKGYIAKFYCAHLPNLLSYTRFLEVMPRLLFLFTATFLDLKVNRLVLNSLTPLALKSVITFALQDIKHLAI